MPQSIVPPPVQVSPGYHAFAESFRRMLLAENKSPHTVDVYVRAVTQLGQFLSQHGMPTDVESIAREHIQEYLADLRQRSKASSVNTRFRSLQQFFRWLLEEGEIASSPMARMKPPKFDVEPPPALTEADIRRLLNACRGNDLPARRDTAIVRVLYDAGLRRAELAGLLVDDIDLDTGVLRVLGKGRKVRYQPIGRKAARDLDRYLRVRARHTEHHRPELWLGRGGPMTASGIYQVVRDRGRLAGIGAIHPHQLRHAFAHAMKSGGGSDDDLMRLGGWSSRQMIARYGAAQADERARETHRRLSPGDKL